MDKWESRNGTGRENAPESACGTKTSNFSNGCRTLGIMAGSGKFPFLVAEGARQEGFKVVICGFHGNTDPALAASADAFIQIPLGQLNALIQFFKKNGVAEACMAGAINKARALHLKPDLRAAKLLFRLASNRGDDALLRAVADELRTEGIRMVRPESLVPALRGPEGILSGFSASKELWEDIRFGWRAGRHLGLLDIGQCLIVKNGIVVAVEALEGTDAALARAGELAGPGCTAVKLAKREQDERLDLPSLGTKTIDLLQRYRYAALAYEAGKTLFFDREQSMAQAERAGLFVFGIPPEAEAFFERMLS